MSALDLILELYYKHRNDHDKELLQHPERIKIYKEYKKIWTELQEALPKGKKELLFRIEELDNYAGNIDSTHCYIHGFKDGANLMIETKN